MTPSIRSTSDIRRLQQEAREQRLPSVRIRDFDKMDEELQRAFLKMAKALAKAVRHGGKTKSESELIADEEE